MKKLTLLLSISLGVFFANKIWAQDDLAGIYTDDVKVEKIDCWTFDKMNLVFPVPKVSDYSKYDIITVDLILSSEENASNPFVWRLIFTRENMGDYFKGVQYGVWKFLQDKTKDKVQMYNYTKTYFRKDFAVIDYDVLPKQQLNWTLQIATSGQTITGYYFDAYGNKQPKYGNMFYFYKSNPIAVSRCEAHSSFIAKKNKKCDFDLNVTCSNPGSKTSLDIKPSPGYLEFLGIIKK